LDRFYFVLGIVESSGFEVDMNELVQAEHWDGPRYIGQFSPVINNVRKAYVD